MYKEYMSKLKEWEFKMVEMGRDDLVSKRFKKSLKDQFKIDRKVDLILKKKEKKKHPKSKLTKYKNKSVKMRF